MARGRLPEVNWPASSDKSAPGSARDPVSRKKISDVNLWSPCECTHACTHDNTYTYTTHKEEKAEGEDEEKAEEVVAAAALVMTTQQLQ